MKSTFDIKRTVLFFTLFMTAGHIVQAQGKLPHEQNEVALRIGGGVSGPFGTLPSSYDKGMRPSMDIGVRYDYYFRKKWSAGVEVNYVKYGMEFTIDNPSGSLRENNGAMDKVSYEAVGYNELWNMSQVSIPITVQYLTSGVTSFYVRTGISYGLTMNSKADLQWKGLETKVEYIPGVQVNNRIGNTSRKHEIDLEKRLAWVGEMGVKHELAYNRDIYVGVYFDYGLNNMAKNVAGTKGRLLTLNQSAENSLEMNSMLESSGTKLSVKTYTIGMKVAYGFKW